MTAPVPASGPGWFGKLSFLGDFASRRLPPEWVQACDRWLSAGMAQGQARLAGGWLPAYLAAPAWRFAWAPQVVDERWWFGLLMPSCDRVGRYYPLLLAQSRHWPPQDRVGFAHLDLWWQELTRAALNTLADGATLEAFESALAELPPWPAVAPPLPHRSGDAGLRQWRLSPGMGLDELAHCLSTQALRERLTGHGLWWSWVADGADGRCLETPGLPGPDLFVHMMSR